MAKKKKKPVIKETKEEALRRKEEMRNKAAFQDFLPITDVKNGCFVDKNNNYYPVIKIGTRNLDLMSKEDKLSLASYLEEIFGSLKTKHYQFSIVPMPYDITDWNTNMSDIIEEISNNKQRVNDEIMKSNTEWEEEIAKKKRQVLDARLQIVREQKNWVTDKVQSGRLATKKCYLILDFDNCKDARTANVKIRETIERFASKDVETSMSTDRELRLLLNILCNPLQSSAHSIQSTRIPPLYLGKK